jgi:hypothetical protein
MRANFSKGKLKIFCLKPKITLAFPRGMIYSVSMANDGHDNSITGELKMTIAQYNAQRAEIVAHYKAQVAQEQDSLEIKMLEIDLNADLRRLDNAMLAAALY